MAVPGTYPTDHVRAIFRQRLVDDAVAVLQGLDGRKMSKSYNNTIPLFLPEKQLKKHINKKNSLKYFGWSETFKEINYDQLFVDIDKYSNDSILTENEFNAIFKSNRKS